MNENSKSKRNQNSTKKGEMSTQLSAINKLSAQKTRNTGKLKTIVIIQLPFKIFYTSLYNVEEGVHDQKKYTSK